MLLRGYKMLPKKTVSEGTRFEECLLVACGIWLICVCGYLVDLCVLGLSTKISVKHRVDRHGKNKKHIAVDDSPLNIVFSYYIQA